MGLDITAYTKCKLLVEGMSVDEWENKYDWDKTSFVNQMVADHFPGAADGLRGGAVYEHGDSFGFRAGSYSGYGSWREWLSVTMLKVGPETVWQNEAIFKSRPFWRLINFSDCEGFIGPVASAKLARDFADWQHVVDAMPQDDWRVEKYAQWRKAFEMAADDGYVRFH